MTKAISTPPTTIMMPIGMKKSAYLEIIKNIYQKIKIKIKINNIFMINIRFIKDIGTTQHFQTMVKNKRYLEPENKK
jgi:hypothetical protein